MQTASKQRTLLILLCVLLSGGIAAEGAAVYRRMHRAPLPVSTGDVPQTEPFSAPVRDIEKELLDSVKAQDYAAVNELLCAYYEDKKPPEAVTEALRARIAALQSDFQEGTADADRVQTELRSIAMLPLTDISEAAKAVLESVRMQAAAMTVFKQAEGYAAAGDYAAAIECYGRVPKTEKTLAAEAERRITACQEMLRESAAAEAKQAFASGDYDTALQTLADALTLLPEDETLNALLTEILDTERTALRRALLLEAGTLFGSGDYAGTFAKFTQMPEMLREDAVIQQAKANYQQKYLRELPYAVSALLKSGDFSAAEAQFSEAEEIFPDAAVLPALREQIAEYQPQKLSALENSDFSDFYTAESILTDCKGNEYEPDGNLYYSYDGDLSGRHSGSGTFLTGGKYAKLSLTAAPMQGFDPQRTVFLEISADGKKLETYTVTAKTGVLHIRLDIGSAKELRFRVLPAGTEDLRNTALILADGVVSKG